MAMGQKGTKPEAKDQNVSGRGPFTPAPAIYSKSDGGRYSRSPIASSEPATTGEKGTGKKGNC